MQNYTYEIVDETRQDENELALLHDEEGKFSNICDHFSLFYYYSFITEDNHIHENESEDSYGDNLETEARELISGWQAGQPLPEEMQTQNTVCLKKIHYL